MALHAQMALQQNATLPTDVVHTAATVKARVDLQLSGCPQEETHRRVRAARSSALTCSACIILCWALVAVRD